MDFSGEVSDEFYEGRHEQQAKFVLFKSFFFANSTIFRKDFQSVVVIPRLSTFNFLALKIENADNKNFHENVLHIQEANTKKFHDTRLLN